MVRKPPRPAPGSQPGAGQPEVVPVETAIDLAYNLPKAAYPPITH